MGSKFQVNILVVVDVIHTPRTFRANVSVCLEHLLVIGVGDKVTVAWIQDMDETQLPPFHCLFGLRIHDVVVAPRRGVKGSTQHIVKDRTMKRAFVDKANSIALFHRESVV